MLDKIVISKDRKEAKMIFTDRSPFTITSDTDVTIILSWFLNDPRAHMVINGDKVIGLELRKFDDEITQNIFLKNAA
jgi:hypothetical protein